MHNLTKQNIELISTLTANHLKIKYKRTSLGFLWSLLNPLLSVGVISLVFSVIMGMPYGEFVVMFFPAFMAWTMFSGSVLGATTSIINNEALIKKTPINIMIFPIVNVAINFVEFILTFFAFLLIAILIGYEPGINLLYLPVSIILLLAISMGVALIVSVISTYFRDMAYLISVLLQLWFYLSPVLYPKDFILGRMPIVDLLMTLNPMVYFIALFRDPITYDKGLTFELLGLSVAMSVVMLIVGNAVFNKYRHKLVYRL